MHSIYSQFARRWFKRGRWWRSPSEPSMGCAEAGGAAWGCSRGNERFGGQLDEPSRGRRPAGHDCGKRAALRGSGPKCRLASQKREKWAKAEWACGASRGRRLWTDPPARSGTQGPRPRSKTQSSDFIAQTLFQRLPGSQSKFRLEY